MSWRVIDIRGIVQHVIPVDDLRPHLISTFCWCKPKQDTVEKTVFIHNAMDERESYEQGRAAS